MKNIEDILQNATELKQSPLTVPENYFGTAKGNLKSIARPSVESVTVLGRLVPYATMAAVLALMVTAGTFFLKKATPSVSDEEFIVLTSLIPMTDPDAIWHSEPSEELAEAKEEDIVKYLIYNGVSAEEIEMLK